MQASAGNVLSQLVSSIKLLQTKLKNLSFQNAQSGITSLLQFSVGRKKNLNNILVT